MAKVIPFEKTEYTLQRRIERECQKHEKEMMQKAAWMWQFLGLQGCHDEESWESYLSGDYEL